MNEHGDPIFLMFISWKLITPSFKKSLIEEQFQGNYLKFPNVCVSSFFIACSLPHHFDVYFWILIKLLPLGKNTWWHSYTFSMQKRLPTVEWSLEYLSYVENKIAKLIKLLVHEYNYRRKTPIKKWLSFPLI